MTTFTKNISNIAAYLHCMIAITISKNNPMNTINANKTLSQPNGSDTYHKYLFGMYITDGALQLATNYQCFWFLDIIAAYQQQLKIEYPQVWTLKKNAHSSAFLVAKNDCGKVLVRKKIQYNNIKAEQATVRVEGNVILPGSEF